MSAIAALLHILALPGVLLTVDGLRRLVRDVWVAKINAKARVEVARLRYGYRLRGGVHRRR
jgi:hypothetical protein